MRGVAPCAGLMKLIYRMLLLRAALARLNCSVTLVIFGKWHLKMASGQNWSNNEIEAIVADYMQMLTLELAGQRYNKSAHRKALRHLLSGRSDSSVELKHRNISAALLDLGCVWIPGYKPLPNYQQALANAVENWLLQNQQFDRIALAAVEQPAVEPALIDFATLITEPPQRNLRAAEPVSRYGYQRREGAKRDYVAREARNTALGQAGEALVLKFEHFRLAAAGQSQLADRVEHVAQTRGDGLGYDILSFETSGEERFIEVKTTAFAKETPFFASRNEVEFARDVRHQFHLYRLYEFRKMPRLFDLIGPIEAHCLLDPISYICRLA